jgi:AcrR family transcriptional regulator
MSEIIAARHHEVRAAVVRAARTLLVEVGHEKLSLRAIAKQAGYSPASLYEYFDGKDAILRAVQDEVEARLLDALVLAEKSEPPGRRRIVAVLLAYIRFAHEHAHDFLLLYVKMLARPTVLAGEHHAPFLLLVRVVESAAQEGEIRIRDGMPSVGVAYGLWAAAHGMAVLQLTFLSSFPADFTQADRWMLVDFCRGLARDLP